jgi:hypothetical protein
VSFHVDLDVPAELSNRSTRDLTITFASRYLNAVRFSAPDLEGWFREHRESACSVPSACSALECPHAEVCHAAFGSQDGYGLYPFNGEALVRLLRGISEGSGFNPRRLVKDVLKQILENHTDNIDQGRFPPRSLLAEYGGSHLPPRIATELERRDAANADRRRALLELYSGQVNEIGLHNLHAGIHEAFDLPPLRKGGPAKPQTPPATESTTPAPVPDPLRPHLDALSAWSNQRAKMPQTLLNYLRPLIYGSVVHHIAWDREMLVRERLASQTTHFRQRGISFEDQAVEPARSAVSLNLPLAGQSRAETVLALQALVRFDHHRNWNYPGGTEDLRTYARHLDQWSDHIVAQFRRPVIGTQVDWDPVPALVEVIAVGARLCRTDTNSDRTIAEELDAMLALPPPTPPDGLVRRNAKWEDLAHQYRRRAETLRDLFLARVGCAKGGSKRVITIDASQVLTVLKRLRASGKLQETVPNGLPPEYEAFVQMHGLLAAQLTDAVSDEASAWLRWDAEYGVELRSCEECRKFIGRLQDFAFSATKAGLLPGQLRTPFEEAIGRFRPKDTDRLIRVLDLANAASAAEERFAIVSMDFLPVMQQAQALVDAARKFVVGAERRADDELQNSLADADALRRELDALREASRTAADACEQLAGLGSAKGTNAD